MTLEVCEDGKDIVIPVEGLSVKGVSVAIRMNTLEAQALADSLDKVVTDRILGYAGWESGVSMKDVMNAEAEGSKLRYMEKGRTIDVRIRGLRPCPFCGHRNPRMHMRCDRSLNEPRIFKRISCWYCCIQTPESAGDVLSHVKTWNRRV